jgi:hypothetical protein
VNRCSAWTAVLLLFVGLGAIAASIGLPNGWRHREAGPDAAPETAPTAAYASEQDWIVAQVVRPIAEAAAFANGHVADLATRHISVVTEAVEPQTGMPRFAITGAATGAAPLHVVITDHLWAPDAYTDLARGLFGASRSTPARAVGGADANAGSAVGNAGSAGANTNALTPPTPAACSRR